jgi:hypothetical protein
MSHTVMSSCNDDNDDDDDNNNNNNNSVYVIGLVAVDSAHK